MQLKQVNIGARGEYSLMVLWVICSSEILTDKFCHSLYISNQG